MPDIPKTNYVIKWQMKLLMKLVIKSLSLIA